MSKWGDEYAGRKKDSIVGFMIWFKKEHDYWPTIRQIQDYMGFKSSNTAWRWLRKLADEGRITRVGTGYIVPGGAWSYQGDEKICSNQENSH